MVTSLWTSLRLKLQTVAGNGDVDENLARPVSNIAVRGKAWALACHNPSCSCIRRYSGVRLLDPNIQNV
jgi:hypothetical protein